MFEGLGVDLPPFARGWLPATGAPEDAGRVFSIVSFPHPSGRNLVWNNRESWRQARQLAISTGASDVPFGLPEEVEEA